MFLYTHASRENGHKGKKKYRYKLKSLSMHESIQWHYMEVPCQHYILAALSPARSDDTY